MRCPACPDQTLLMMERQGVEIDYCPKCRGVWLDRGELDKLITVATRYDPPARPASQAGYQGYQSFQHAAPPPPAPAPPVAPPPPPPPQPAQRYANQPPFADSDYPKHGGHRHHDSRSYGKRKSWLSDLFD